MQADPAAAVRELVHRVAREVRWRRAAHAAWRGAFWGALAAVGLLLLKGWLGEEAVAWSVAMIAAAALLPAAAAALLPVPALLAARLADRAYRLQDRLATALECAAAPGARPALVGTLAADAAARAAQVLATRAALPRREVREKRLLAVPLALAVALALLPPLPDPVSGLAERISLAKAARENDPHSVRERLARLAHPGAQAPQAPAAHQAAEHARTQGAEGAAGPAQYRDRALARANPDFESFVKQGDDRLRLLERTERLPDLESDFASSQYRALMRRSRELSAGATDPNRLSAQRLAELLREMERLGRRSGAEWMADVHEGLDALEQGEFGQALNAMRTALERLRRAEERQRSGRELRGGREERGDGGRGGGAQSEEAGSDGRAEADRPGTYGLGKGRNEKGEPTARLRSTPYDTAVRGQRGARMPSADTGALARPGNPRVQLEAAGAIAQYRRMMEDAIAREEVPRAYHEQVREYFRSLQER